MSKPKHGDEFSCFLVCCRRNGHLEILFRNGKVYLHNHNNKQSCFDEFVPIFKCNDENAMKQSGRRGRFLKI